MSQCRMKPDIAISLAALLLAATGAAASSLDREVQFNIPAQSLSPALIQFSNQADVQVITKANDVSGEETGGVAGRMTAGEALKQLLRETGFSYLLVGDNTVEISTTAARTAHSMGAVDAMQGGFLLAQTEGSPSQAPTSAPQPPEGSEPLDEVIVDIPEILVRGSRTLNLDIRRTANDVQPYVVFDREALERSNVRNLDEFLRKRITASGSNIGPRQLPGISSATSSFSLRGLDIGETLILVDGHRKGNWSFAGTPQQPDVNGIPLGAIERIEVLPTTASGIYGGDATGGVINIVMRRDYSGIEAKVSYDSAFSGDAPQRQIEISSGFNLEGGRTNVLLSGSFSDQDALFVGERDFAEDARALVLRNNRDSIFQPFSNPILGRTSNIASAFGTDLTLKSGGSVGSPFTFVPEGYAGVDSDDGAAFIANAGNYNFALANTDQANGGAREGLLNAMTRKTLMTTVRRDFTENLELYVDASVSETETRSYSSGNQGGFGSTFFIPGSALGNPFNEDVMVTTPLLGADTIGRTELRAVRAIAGMLVRLPGQWKAGLSYTWDRTRFGTVDPGTANLFDFSPTGAPAAVQSGAIDIFRDTNLSGADFSAFVQPSSAVLPGYTTLQDATLLLNGPLWTIPGGAISLSTSFGHRRDHVSENVQSAFFAGTEDFFTNYPRHQTIDSIYVEASVPIVSEKNSMPGIRLLELQLAGRWDSYDVHSSNSTSSSNPTPREDFTSEFSSTNPTIGLRYQFVPDVTLRASYNTGFLAPTVGQLNDSITITDVGGPFFPPAFDPLRGGEQVRVVSLVSRGSELAPEESEGWNVGVILEPRFAPGLRLSVDWVWLEKTNNIGFLPFFDFQSYFLFEDIIPGIIVRSDPAPGDPFGVGPVSEFSVGTRNLSRGRIEAYDVALNYRRETASHGAFTFAASGTRNMHNEAQVLAGLPITESIDTSSSTIKWKGHGELAWEYRNWLVSWTSSYYHSFKINSFALPNFGGQERIPSQLYHDLYTSYNFGEQPQWDLLANTEIQLGINNVFDKEPPLEGAGFLSFGTYYSSWADPRLATYSVAIKKAF